MKNKRVTQVVNDANVTTEILASAIIHIDEGIRKLRVSGLNEKALLVLLSHSSACSQAVCKRVLTSLQNLKQDYVR